jgi:head-tail adaptor
MLRRSRGIRIGEALDRDRQYFHYLAMQLYALSVSVCHVPDYQRKDIEIVCRMNSPHFDLDHN